MAMITIVGCGPGALDHLPPVAHRAIAEADVLVGAGRLDGVGVFGAEVRGSRRRISVNSEHRHLHLHAARVIQSPFWHPFRSYWALRG